MPAAVDRYTDAAELREVLVPLPMSIDILMYSTEEVERRAHLRGTTLYHALHEGEVLYAARGCPTRQGIMPDVSQKRAT